MSQVVSRDQIQTRSFSSPNDTLIDLSGLLDDLTDQPSSDDVEFNQDQIKFQLYGASRKNRVEIWKEPICLHVPFSYNVEKDSFTKNKTDASIFVSNQTKFELVLIEAIPTYTEVQLLVYIQWLHDDTKKPTLTVSKTSTKNGNNILILSSKKDQNQHKFVFYLLKNTFKVSRDQCCLSIFVRINGSGALPVAKYHINMHKREYSLKSVESHYVAKPNLLKEGFLDYPSS